MTTAGYEQTTFRRKKRQPEDLLSERLLIYEAPVFADNCPFFVQNIGQLIGR